MQNSSNSNALLAAATLAVCFLALVSARKQNGRQVRPITTAQLPPPQLPISVHYEQFEVEVSPADKFKFNAAHFIAFQGFRERLHGHNYTVGVKLVGRRIQSDGYLMDYGQIKEICGRICKEELNERFLLPLHSDVLDISFGQGEEDDNVHLFCKVDGSAFSIPRGDCAELPIIHSSTEELAVFLWERIVHDFTITALQERGIFAMEISVAEMPHQRAVFRRELHDENVPMRAPTPKPCL